MFRIKICGVTSVDDARLAVEAGADAIGLNFYPPSKRYLSVAQARTIAAAVAGDALVVGVFVNAPPALVRETAATVSLGAVQLHGDESVETLADIAEYPVIRARRMGEGGLADILADLQACRAAGALPSAVLVDAPAAPGQYGGTGQSFAWSQLEGWRAALGATPLVLAGGLRPENVAAAIAAVKPSAVDVASGVETAPGRKHHDLVREFVAAARAALGEGP